MKLHQINIIAIITIPIIIGIYWYGIEVPTLYSLPIDYERDIEYVGTDMIVSNFGDKLANPTEERQISIEDVINVDNNILEINVEIISKHVDTNEIVFHAFDTYSVDRVTKKHIDSDLYYAFPSNVEKKTYNFLHPAIHVPNTLIFKETEKINTFDSYVFECDSSVHDNTNSFPQFSGKAIFVKYACKLWIEPKTGDLLKLELFWENFVVENGGKIVPVQSGEVSTSDYAVSTLTQLTKQKLDLLLFYEQAVPLTIVLLSSLTLTIQIIFTRLTSEKKQKEYDRLKAMKKSTDLEEQLAIQSNLKRALDESSDVAITNKNGIIINVNKHFCNSSKYSKEELIGKNHRILKSGYHSKEFYKNLWGTITSGKVWHDVIQNKAKDGTLYWNDIVIVPFLDKNKEIKEYVSIRRDITERKKLESEKLKNEKMVVLGNFSSRLAHDLRNPLSIIKVSLENLKALYGLDDTKQKYFDKVDRSINRMTHQMDNVLDFVREKTVELNRIKLSEIIAESRDSLVIPDDMELILPKNDTELLCDKKQFSIALNNIILNGIQAIEGAGTIEITVEENNKEIIIQIKDSGKNIPNEDLDKIFDPLFTTKMQGTGLGLASVKSIIDAHKGTISVKNDPVTFTITLPKSIS